jgi:hypothetical protein
MGGIRVINQCLTMETAGQVAQVVEHLLSKCEALSSISSTTKKKTRRRKTERKETYSFSILEAKKSEIKVLLGMCSLQAIEKNPLLSLPGFTDTSLQSLPL